MKDEDEEKWGDWQGFAFSEKVASNETEKYLKQQHHHIQSLQILMMRWTNYIHK